VIRWIYFSLDLAKSIFNQLKLSVFLFVSHFLDHFDSDGSDSGVDVVITWVDGDDVLHQWKRERALSKFKKNAVSKTSKAKRRFSDNQELRYCIRSIRNHAPWVRRIWLLTDHQFPFYLRFWAARRAGIRVVTHKQVFSGLKGVLPTFNSLSIESVLWRIPGLSESFIYFNDDVFLSAPVTKEEFFSEKVVIRGRMRRMPVFDTAKPHFKHQINAFGLLGSSEDNYFSPAHFAHPLKKSVLKKLFEQLSDDFMKNLAHRFRTNEQFWPIALADYYMVQHGLGELQSPNDGFVFSVAKCKNLSGCELDSLLKKVESGAGKFLCVNFMEMLEEKVPDLRVRLDAIVGPRQFIEKG